MIGELLAAAAELEQPTFGLSEDAVSRLAAVARHQGRTDWEQAARDLPPEQLERLVRFFTLAERLPGWDAADKSPVIPLARELKRRDAWPAALTGWIKANTDNRFLPYGSLMDRL